MDTLDSYWEREKHQADKVLDSLEELGELSMMRNCVAAHNALMNQGINDDMPFGRMTIGEFLFEDTAVQDRLFLAIQACLKAAYKEWRETP
jgi:hypothetical protein